MIKIHKKLWAVAREGSDLSYMTYHEDNKSFQMRRDTGMEWAERGHGTGTASESTHDNIPTTGFKIGESVTRWSTSNKLFRVEDPRGFVVEVPTSSISNLIGYTTITQGVVQEPCVWARDGSNHILLPEGSEPYEQGVSNMSMIDDMVSMTTLDKYDLVRFSASSKDEYIYLGRGKATWDYEVRQRMPNTPSHYGFSRYSYSPIDSLRDALVGEHTLTSTSYKHIFKKVKAESIYGSWFSKNSAKVCHTGKGAATDRVANKQLPLDQSIIHEPHITRVLWDIGQYTEVTDISICWKDEL